jgi:exodeoxyribonuclease-5
MSAPAPQSDMFYARPLGISPRLARARAEAFRTAPDARSPDVTLTEPQASASAAALEFVATAAPGDRFLLEGLAGTGKTVVMAAIAEALRRQPGREVQLAAPTGKASTVLSRKTRMRTVTLHSLLYTPLETQHGLQWEKRWPAGCLSGSVVLVDEASMVNEQLGTDLIETGAIVVAAGDPGQLPPVEGTAFFTSADFTLTTILRQVADSPIIRAAHAVRAGGAYRADGDAFQVLERATAETFAWADIVLCWCNETRHRLNRALRQCRGIAPDAPPQAGEPVICLRNDRQTGIMNGETFVLGSDFRRGRSLTLVGGPQIERPWFEPHGGEAKPPQGATPFGLAYCITTHKSQGSEWPRVVIVDEFTGADRARWIYTAITRAATAVRIVRKRSADAARRDAR